MLCTLPEGGLPGPLKRPLYYILLPSFRTAKKNRSVSDLSTGQQIGEEDEVPVDEDPSDQDHHERARDP